MSINQSIKHQSLEDILFDVSRRELINELLFILNSPNEETYQSRILAGGIDPQDYNLWEYGIYQSIPDDINPDF